MKTVYISGAVTSDPDFRKKFDKAEKLLYTKGYIPVNPVKGETEGEEWEYYLRKDLKKLLDCNGIYILSDWNKSRGAQLEIHVALELGLEVILEGEL